MADIELVIRISEEMYKDIQGRDWKNGKKWFSEEWQAIHNGTPLPKRHGRVIDYGYVVDAIDDWINAGEYNYTNATDYLRNRIRNVPTIIEADTEESNTDNKSDDELYADAIDAFKIYATGRK